jgi:hypothetical protein
MHVPARIYSKLNSSNSRTVLSHTTRETVLAAPARGRMARFLSEWVNVSRDEDQFRLAKRFPGFHAPSYRVPEGVASPKSPKDFDGTVYMPLPIDWTESLQAAWREPNLRMKLYMLAHLQAKTMWSAATGRESAARPNPPHSWADNVAAAVIFALRIAERLAVCPNPECPAPLFIRKRKNQGQCSPECARWAQRKAKLDYWNRVGRKKREAQSNKKFQRKGKRQ